MKGENILINDVLRLLKSKWKYYRFKKNGEVLIIIIVHFQRVNSILKELMLEKKHMAHYMY